MVKKSLILTGMMCAALVCAQGARRAPVVSVTEVVEMEQLESRKYTGIVVAPEVVQVVPRVSGEIIKVGFKDGDVVKKGQLLYQLDDIRYKAVVEGLKAKISGINAKIKGFEAKIASCKAKQVYAQKNYNRISQLFNNKATSLDSLESAKSAIDAANADLASAEADLLAAKADLAAANAELITAMDDLKNTKIIAPIDGIAGVNKTTLGNYITPGSGVLVTIVKVNPIRVKFAISTSDFLNGYGTLKRMQESATVRVRLSNGKEYPLDGQVAFLNNEANSRTDAILVYAEFKNAKNILINGSTVTVTLNKKDKKKVLAIPLSAVVYDVKGACVYVVGDDGKAKKHYVVSCGSDSEFQYVVSGVSKGQKVISAGTHKVMIDGMPVQILTPARK
ncbi:MAG: efflux RND transporter periplasmic adaptor subunit [Lentisphaeria bacterium]|nr:efflux RND transporter periplasmic adaptor subunit [Lentisphaeria bacterium]